MSFQRKNGWIYTLWYIQTKEYCSAIKRDEPLIHSSIDDLKWVLLSERSWIQKTTWHVIPFIFHSAKCKNRSVVARDGERSWLQRVFEVNFWGDGTVLWSCAGGCTWVYASVKTHKTVRRVVLLYAVKDQPGLQGNCRWNTDCDTGIWL